MSVPELVTELPLPEVWAEVQAIMNGTIVKNQRMAARVLLACISYASGQILPADSGAKPPLELKATIGPRQAIDALATGQKLGVFPWTTILAELVQLLLRFLPQGG